MRSQVDTKEFYKICAGLKDQQCTSMWYEKQGLALGAQRCPSRTPLLDSCVGGLLL